MRRDQQGYPDVNSGLHDSAGCNALELQPLQSSDGVSSDRGDPELSIQSMHMPSSSDGEPDHMDEASCQVHLVIAPGSHPHRRDLHAIAESHLPADTQTSKEGAAEESSNVPQNGRHQESGLDGQQGGSQTEEEESVGPGSDWEAACLQERQQRSLLASTRDSSSSLTADAGFPSKAWQHGAWAHSSHATAHYAAVEQTDREARPRGEGMEASASFLERGWATLKVLPWSQVQYCSCNTVNPSLESSALLKRCSTCKCKPHGLVQLEVTCLHARMQNLCTQ